MNINYGTKIIKKYGINRININNKIQKCKKIEINRINRINLNNIEKNIEKDIEKNIEKDIEKDINKKEKIINNKFNKKSIKIINYRKTQFGLKYFKELPSINHIDRIYGNPRIKFTKKFIIENLKIMLNVFINICENNDIKPVLAHGGLIGHYFNNKMLPWDDDIDLVFIGESINNFLRIDLKKINLNKYFFLDINPNSLNRSIKDRVNVIDARFISKQYGFFIDITFLTENKILTKKHGKVVINCKSPHYYFLDDFLPLKKEKFEEMEIYVPNKIVNVLSYEYGKKVFKPKFKNWIFKDNLWQRKENKTF